MSKLSWSYSMYSQAMNCLNCFHKQYVLGQKPEGLESIDLAFGSALHSAVNGALTGEDGLELFKLYWGTYKGKPLQTGRFKYDTLSDTGERLVSRFVSKYADRFKLVAAEQRLHAEYKGVKLNGQFDFYGDLDGILTLADFKTSAYNYQEQKKLTALQLNLYAYLAIQNGYKPPTQLCYQVFNKSLVTIQTPLVWNFNEENMHHMLEDMVTYCANFETLLEASPVPRNPNFQYHNFNCY